MAALGEGLLLLAAAEELTAWPTLSSTRAGSRCWCLLVGLAEAAARSAAYWPHRRSRRWRERRWTRWRECASLDFSLLSAGACSPGQHDFPQAARYGCTSSRNFARRSPPVGVPYFACRYDRTYLLDADPAVRWQVSRYLRQMYLSEAVAARARRRDGRPGGAGSWLNRPSKAGGGRGQWNATDRAGPMTVGRSSTPGRRPTIPSSSSARSAAERRAPEVVRCHRAGA